MEFSPEELPELLSVYYKRLFPYKPFYRWLSYNNPETFANREMSFNLPGDIYVRYLSFDKLEDFEQELQKKCPEKIDIGGVYNMKPRLKRITSNFDVIEKELVFDIDITDYDPVRVCCQEANVCSKCWKLMSLATKILDRALRDDFGFNHLLWVFSGRRGIHCWVCDEIARTLEPKVRSDIAEYLQLLTREDSNGKIAHLNDIKVHPSITRALEIIRTDFVDICVEGQNLLGTAKSMNKILNLMEDGLRKQVEPLWEQHSNSVDRWNAFVDTFNYMMQKGELKRSTSHLIDEIMLQYAYPRLDINVSKGANHLLKSPFCIHPKTGKICLPFNPANAFSFNPDNVPTIKGIVEEIRKFDEKEAEAIQESDIVEKRRVKDYKKTSMYKGMQVFEEFLRKLGASLKPKENAMEL